MSILGLLFVSLLCAGTIVWLLTYVPLSKRALGKNVSPRLLACKFLIPMDVILTSTLVLGPLLIGISGIGVFIAGVFTATGLSLGTAFVRRILVPIWTRKFESLTANDTPIHGAATAVDSTYKKSKGRRR